MAWRETTMSEILIPREDRFKAPDPAIAKLERIEKIDFSGNVVISKKSSKTDMIVVHPGDFVISGINVAKGAMAIFQGVKPVKATIHYSSYTLNDDVINVEYLKRFLKSPIFIELLKDQVPGGIKTEIKPKHLLPLKIQLPGLDEQKAILNRFLNTEEEYKCLTTEIEKQKKILAKYRQAILQEAIEGKLTEDWREQNPDVEPAAELLKRIAEEQKKVSREGAKTRRKQNPLPEIRSDEIPFDIPESWQWCRFVQVADIKSNLVDPKEYPDSPHIAPNNIEKNTGKLLKYRTVSEDEVMSANHLFFPNQLIYSKVRPQLNKICHVDFSGLCSADMYPIESDIEQSFLKKCMLASYFLDEVAKFDNRVKMPKVNQNQLNSIPIPLPPLTEQREIVRRVESKFALCDQLEAQINASAHTAETLSAAILQELFDQKGGEG